MAITRVRSGFSSRQLADALGPLAGLSGKWVGRGFNIISLPAFDKNPPSDGPRPFRLLLSATNETLEFVPGVEAPNRGADVPGTKDPIQGQDDINLVGLRYLQTISDLNSGEPLHVEPGFWLNVPATQIPAAGSSIVRQGSIPHGVSVLAIGTGGASPTGKPDFTTNAPSSLPTPAPLPLGFGYVDLFGEAQLPAPFTNKKMIDSPNQMLSDDFAGYADIVKETTVLQVSTTPSGGLVNIPFLQNSTNNNAAATRVTATFWIETGFSSPPVPKPFAVLQYSQCVILNFQGIDWPHITVATLHKQ